MVSVIIPSFNRGHIIKRSINSVLLQTYKEIEVIVVDDCSTDDTSEVLQSINDKRLKYVRLPKNSGACFARNVGVSMAQGDYIAFQDSDDCWRPEKIENQINFLKKYKADVCFCRSERHNYSKKGTEIYPTIQEGIVRREDMIRSSLASTQTIIAKREVFNDILFDPELRRRQDYDWVLRASKKYIFCLCGDVLVDIYLQNDSITNMSAKKSYETFEYLLNKYQELESEYPFFRTAMLYNIGYYKTMAGCVADREYKLLLETDRTLKNKIYYILCKMKLLKILFMFIK